MKRMSLFSLVVKKVFFAGVLVIGFFSFLPFVALEAHAQTTNSPIFMVTWKASNSYVPSFYPGKALPSYGSKITASLELISNGKIININSQNIYWYQNEVLIGGGLGVKQVTFSPFDTPPNLLALSVELPQYPSGYLAHEVDIPFINPVAVIYAPYPNGTFSTNPTTLTALPYFFNTASAANLSYTWSVNDQTGTNTENPQEAQITVPQGTPSGTPLEVALSIENPAGSTIATANQTLTYQNQL